MQSNNHVRLISILEKCLEYFFNYLNNHLPQLEFNTFPKLALFLYIFITL